MIVSTGMQGRRSADVVMAPRRAAAASPTPLSFSRSLVAAGESKEELHALREALIDHLRPQNVMELILVERIVSAQWKLVRLQAAETAQLGVGEGKFINLGCMIAATDRISIGKHCMLANHCFVADADHRFDDPNLPVTWQGMRSEGPVTIGDNCWFGTNCVVTSGVTIGERTVVGANSVVTRDLPAGVIAAGAPAKVLKEIEFRES